MQKFIIILLLLGSQSVFAQEAITSSLTDEHQQVKGSKIFLVPPPSFSVATQFQGFQDFDRSASLLVAVLESPAQALIEAFTAEALKGQGVKVLKREEITLNGMAGLFITGEQKGYGTTFNKYILVFGDESFTALINGMYPKDDAKELDDLVVKAMRSVLYVDDADTKPLEALNFSINTEGSKLQFANLFSGNALYTVDGNVPPETEDKTNFLAGQSISQSIILDDKAFAINRLKKLPYDDISFREADVQAVEIDGLKGFSIPAIGTEPKSGDKRFIYQTLLFDGEGNYFIFLGTTNQDFETNHTLFEQLTESFSRK
ncbi:MAG: hypothetical protein AAFN10_26355 [Bacteroidota bacterium]